MDSGDASRGGSVQVQQGSVGDRGRQDELLAGRLGGWAVQSRSHGCVDQRGLASGDDVGADASGVADDGGLDAPDDFEDALAVSGARAGGRLPSGEADGVAGCVADDRPLSRERVADADAQLDRAVIRKLGRSKSANAMASRAVRASSRQRA